LRDKWYPKETDNTAHADVLEKASGDSIKTMERLFRASDPYSSCKPVDCKTVIVVTKPFPLGTDERKHRGSVL